MRESQFGFEYTWSDLRPIRALVIVVLAAQLVCMVVGLAYAPHTDWFHRLWFGGAIATFPAFVVGLFVQTWLRPGSIGENIVVVRRLGFIAALLTLVAFFMPELGFK
jgi:hypothetical protein